MKVKVKLFWWKKEVKCKALLHKMNGRVHRKSRHGSNLISIAKLYLISFPRSASLARTTSFQRFERPKVIAEEKCFINLTFAFDFKIKKTHFHMENRERVCVCLRKHVKQLRMGDWKQLIFLFAKNYANTPRRRGKSEWKWSVKEGK